MWCVGVASGERWGNPAVVVVTGVGFGQVCQNLRVLEHRLVGAKRAFESGRAMFQELKGEIFELLAYFMECRDAIPDGEEVDLLAVLSRLPHAAGVPLARSRFECTSFRRCCISRR